MKKTGLLLAAMLLFCGCSETENDTEKPVPEDVTDTSDTGEAAPEEPFITYDSGSMQDVSVSVSLKDGELPIEVSAADLSGLDFGKKIPPCIIAENWKDYYSVNGRDVYFNEEEIEENKLREPHDGVIQDYTTGDGDVYFFVSYDMNCREWNHSTAFFRYDTASSVLTEIKSFESLEEPLEISVCSMKYLNGKLYFISAVHDSETAVHYAIYSLDTVTGELEVSFDTAAFSDMDAADCPIDELVCQDGRLFAVDYTLGSGTDVTEQVIYEMDNGTGQWSEIWHGKDLYKPARICGGKIVTTDRNENRKVCVHTDSYDFVTPYRTAQLVYADDKEAALLQADRLSEVWTGYTENSFLQVYDFDKNRHYTFDLDDLGTGTEIEKVENGYLITNGEAVRAPVYYIIPELGIAFEAASGDSQKYEYPSVVDYSRADYMIRTNNDRAAVTDGQKIYVFSR